jgi:hypothetical protein
MKQLLITALLFSISTSIFAQNDSCNTSLADFIVMNENQLKEYEECILEISEFVLSEPLRNDETEDTLQSSGLILFMWMLKTPDHLFAFNKHMGKLSKGNSGLDYVYYSALVNSALNGDPDHHETALKTMVEWVRNPKNNVKQTGKIKKLLVAWESGQYSKYLSS